MTRRTAGLLALVAALPLAAAGQDDPPKEKAGGRTVIPAAFRSYIALDDRFPHRGPADAKPDDLKPDQRDPRDRTGKIHDLVGENGLNPVVAVFVTTDAKKFGPDSGLAKLVKAMDAQFRTPQSRTDRLSGFVIFLKLDPDPALKGKTLTGELTIPEDKPPAAGAKKADRRPAVTAVYGPDGKLVTIDDPVRGESKTEVDYGYPDDEERAAKAKDVRDFAAAVRDEAAKGAAGRRTFLVPFGVGPAKAKEVDAWGIKNDPVTVVMYNRYQTLPNLRWTFAGDGPSDDEIKQVMDTTLKTVRGQAFK